MASKLDRVGVRAYSVFSELKHPKNLGPVSQKFRNFSAYFGCHNFLYIFATPGF